MIRPISSDDIKKQMLQPPVAVDPVVNNEVSYVEDGYSILNAYTTTISIHKKLQVMSNTPLIISSLINIKDLSLLININKLTLDRHLNILKDLCFIKISGNWIKLTETGMKAITSED